MPINRFERALLAAHVGVTYHCVSCGKNTRDTGQGERALELCVRCLFDCYVENAESDYGKGSKEHKEAIANRKRLDKKGGK